MEALHKLQQKYNKLKDQNNLLQMQNDSNVSSAIDVPEIVMEGGKKKYSKNNSASQPSAEGVDYVFHLSEPWFTLISMGLKKVEGRKNSGKFKDMKVGQKIKWYNNDFKPREVVTVVTKKVAYDTFEEYLETEGLQIGLPGIPSMEHGLSVYFKYFNKEQEAKFGVMAIHLKVI